MAKMVYPEDRYQLHVMLLDVGPAPWRRLLVRPDMTIGELHRLIQLCMGWGDRSWHEFWIHGLAQFGRRRGCGGADLSGMAEEPLSSFCLTPGERIGYDYGGWRCQLRLEKVMLVERPCFWPICIGGKWGAPPEWCGSGRSYMTDPQRIRHPFEVIDLLADLLHEVLEDAGQFRERAKQVIEWSRWMHFDRALLNTSLRSAKLTWVEEMDDAFSFATGD
jgi:hypothetical protein